VKDITTVFEFRVQARFTAQSTKYATVFTFLFDKEFPELSARAIGR